MNILKSQKVQTLLVILILVIIAIVLQFASPNIADPDGFYHIRHAEIYRTNGIWDSSFPWTQFSVIKKYGADIWYGFHIFLIPFTYFNDLVFGIKVAGAAITFVALALFFWAVKRLGIKLPALWPILLVAISPDVLYRLTMTRPHNITLGLGFLIFSFFIKGRARSLLIISALLSFIHLALSWIPILIVLALVAAKKLQKQNIEWKKIVAIVAGLTIGLAARPNPLEAVKLAFVQVVQIFIAKLNQIPLYFGRELKSPDIYSIMQNILPLLIILTTAWILFRRKKIVPVPETRHWFTALYASLGLMMIFMILTLTVARRGYDSLIGYGIIVAAALISVYLHKNPQRHRAILSVAIIIIGLVSLNTLPLSKKYMDQAWKPNYLKEVSLWLKENTQPQEIVFNTRWDYFGGLFFWNPNNYYISGMDPVFQYAYNESLYWKAHFLAIDKADKLTCGKIRCTQEETEDTHTALIKDFKASYLMLRQSQNPKLYFYLVKDNKFPLVFDNGQEAVFKIPPL